ncbi:PREDICTED: profilin-4 [Thamnophis sirtalis]|uniref:Profilin n=1 Tax=Thamnophis sirtalis TaxID=35019 RepID=A0A6I9YJ12_9SAUR|nr:PREDICTED: profilin-4 [Thamnophis sirtalis]XP_032072302.1 profilin-4 [Thamnophis elegans]
MNQAQTLLLDGLIKTKHVEKAALIRIADMNVMAATPGFNIQNWALIFVQAFFNNQTQIRKEGQYFNDRYYKCYRADGNSIYLKVKGDGVIIVKTGSFILVGTYCQGMYPSVCVEAVEKLADYLRAKGN